MQIDRITNTIVVYMGIRVDITKHQHLLPSGK